MARALRSDDLDRLAAGIRELPEAIRNEVRKNGLSEAGKIITRHQQRKLERMGLVDTGQLRDSIRTRRTQRYVDIYPSGNRVRKTVRIAKDGPKRVTRNAEVGIVLEYGRGRGRGVIAPREWVGQANKAAAIELVGVVEALYDTALERIFRNI